MSDKIYAFKENEWGVTGWAGGLMEVEREDDKGNKTAVMQSPYQLFVLVFVSTYK